MEAEVLYLANAAREYHADILFSVDYFNALASAAKQAGILYYSWLFHLPQDSHTGIRRQYCLYSDGRKSDGANPLSRK